MAHVCVDKDNTEWICIGCPERDEAEGCWIHEIGYYVSNIELPKGSIEKLIGKKLTWEDEPLEI